MNLSEMLLFADINQVNRIADSYGCGCDRHSKTEMIQALVYSMLDNASLKKLTNQFNELEATFLKLIFLDSRNQFIYEELLAKANQALKFYETKQTSNELAQNALRKGWLFQGVGKKHNLVYLIPQDYKARILQTIKNNLLEKVNILPEINLYRDESSLLVSDLTIFLQFTLKEEVLLTGEGNIYKRQQISLFNKLLVSEDPLGKTKWRFGYGRRYNEYPDRFSLIYDFSYYYKLLHEDEEGFLFLTPLGGRWLNKNDFFEEEFKFYLFWVRLYKHTVHFLQIIIRLIDLAAYNRWVEIESIEQELIFWIKEHYYENREEIFRNRIIKMLFHLGVIQIGEDSNRKYLRVTDRGHKWLSTEKDI